QLAEALLRRPRCSPPFPQSRPPDLREAAHARDRLDDAYLRREYLLVRWSFPYQLHLVFGLESFSRIFVQQLVKQLRYVRHGGDCGLGVPSPRPHNPPPPAPPPTPPRRRSDQHEVAHLRHGFFQTDHHAHGFLPRVQIGAQQLRHSFLFFEGPQQVAQSFSVLFLRHQIGYAFHKNVPARLIGCPSPALVELLETLHQPVVLVALLLDPPLPLRVNVAAGPAAKILVHLFGSRIQLGLAQIVLQPHHTVVHYAGPRYHHSQNLVRALAGKINMIERVFRPGIGDGHTHAARHQRE